MLKYDYRSGIGSDYEKLYYASGLGLVKWELYSSDQLTKTSVFDNYADQPPLRPDLTNACLGTPVTPTVPDLPGSLEEFVDTLYDCVLNVEEPDQEGFAFWLNDLRRGALTIQGAYTEFFRYQGDVSQDRFTRTLFRCTLYREIDADSYTNVQTALDSGAMTRPKLVQAVLTSQEFTSQILPRLKALT